MNVATIGTSKIAHQIVDAFLLCKDVKLEAVYSRKQITADAFAKRYQVDKTYTSIDEMLQDKTIELVYVASPNALHYEQVKQILCAGKHVICEKPITLCAKDFKHLCALAKQHDCFLFEAITTLHMPNYKYLKEHIKDIDDIHLVRCDLSQYSNRYEQLKMGHHQNVFDEKMGGGALYDLGVYCLHFVVGIFGKPKSINSCHTMYQDIDTSGTIVLTYPHMSAVLTFAKDCQGEAGILIQAEKGYWKIQGPCSRVNTLEWIEQNLITEHTKPTKSQHHVHELEDFFEIISNKDHDKERRIWEVSLIVCNIIDEIHRKGNL